MLTVTYEALQDLTQRVLRGAEHFPFDSFQSMVTELVAEPPFELPDHRGSIYSPVHALNVIFGGHFEDAMALAMVARRVSKQDFPMRSEGEAIKKLSWMNEYGIPAERVLHRVSFPLTDPEVLLKVVLSTGVMAPDTPLIKISGEAVSRGPVKEDVDELKRKLTMLKKLRERLKRTATRGPITFNTVLPGTCNQFVRKALHDLIARPGEFNPLFISGGHGTGKTVHLQALVGTLREMGKGEVTLRNGEELLSFLEDLDEVRAEEFLKGVNGWLVVDDIQHVSAERPQKGLVILLKKAVEMGVQAVVACEGPLTALNIVARSLLSSFPRRLITELEAPDDELKASLLKAYLRAKGRTLPEDAIARAVRFMGDDLHNISRAVAVAEGKTPAVVEEPVGSPESRPGESSGPQAAASLSRTLSRTSEEGWQVFTPARSFLLMTSINQLIQAFGGYRGRSLIITRKNPRLLGQELDLPNSILLWLTDRESEAVPTVQPSLEKIIFLVNESLEAGSELVILDGIDYLAMENGFESTMKMIRQIKDDTSMTDSVFIVIYDPAVFTDQERVMLERELITISTVSDFAFINGKLHYR